MSAVQAVRLGALSVRWRTLGVAIAAAFGIAAAGLALVGLMTGSSSFGPAEVLSVLAGGGDAGVTRIVTGIRLPRVITGLFVGAALAVSGALFQSLSRNALGSPDIIGFVTGAATGAIVAITVFAAPPAVVALAAVASGLVTAVVVVLLASRDTESAGYRLILGGIGVGALLAAVNAVLLTRAEANEAIAAQIWLTGSLTARTWTQAVTILVACAVLVPAAIVLARTLSVLESGDDLAVGVGVRVTVTRRGTVLVAVALAAVATAVCGPIGFVALAAPHVARRVAGATAVPVLASALCGAALLVGADVVSQNLPFDMRAPVALVTGAIGGIYLIWLLSRSRSL